MFTLDDVAATDVALYGHKAATLARLRQAGLDVPAGFVIGVTETANLDEAAIAHQMQALPGPVAVRSSGIAEDLPDASFAGQYDTILNVEGPENVLSAVRQCVASASSQRVRAYGGGGALAVLVAGERNTRSRRPAGLRRGGRRCVVGARRDRNAHRYARRLHRR